MTITQHLESMPASMLDFMLALSTYLREMVDEQIQPLKTEMQLIKSLQSEWVDTREAMKITGIKQAQTLKVERERYRTVLVVKFEGRTGKSPRYLRSSLLEYNERRTQRRHIR